MQGMLVPGSDVLMRCAGGVMPQQRTMVSCQQSRHRERVAATAGFDA